MLGSEAEPGTLICNVKILPIRGSSEQATGYLHDMLTRYLNERSYVSGFLNRKMPTGCLPG